MIIALGESIVAIGIGTANLERDWAFAAAVAIAFAGVAVLWWTYFDFTATAAARSLSRASPEARGPLARDVFTIFHYPIVFGIILYAVAAKKTLSDPREPLSQAHAGRSGSGCVFLLGFVLARYRAIRRVAWERLAAATAALLAAATLGGVDALATLGVVIAIVAVAVGIEAARLRETRASFRTG